MIYSGGIFHNQVRLEKKFSANCPRSKRRCVHLEKIGFAHLSEKFLQENYLTRLFESNFK